MHHSTTRTGSATSGRGNTEQDGAHEGPVKPFALKNPCRQIVGQDTDVAIDPEDESRCRGCYSKDL